jgi:pSer/pThr/pTyr-binding forkhead associated (FHA) protein
MADGAPQALTLRSADAPLSIGRGSAMDIALATDPTVSALHAQLTCVAGVWLLVDDGLSSNGSYVNGERVRSRQRLRDGDRLQLGRSVLTFHLAGPPPPTAPTSAPGTVPHAHRAVLAELSRPLLARSRGLPATDTEIALALGVTIATVRDAIAELLVWYGIVDPDWARARTRLAEASANHSGMVAS